MKRPELENMIAEILSWATHNPWFNATAIEDIGDQLEGRGKVSSAQETAVQNVYDFVKSRGAYFASLRDGRKRVEGRSSADEIRIIVRHAINNNGALEFTYFKPSGEIERRRVKPQHITNMFVSNYGDTPLNHLNDNGEYFSGYDLGRKGRRTFKLSRMEKVNLLSAAS